MSYAELWLSFYPQVVRDLGLSQEKDEMAAKILEELLVKKGEDPSAISLAKELLTGKTVIVFGAGPSLQEDSYRISSIIRDCRKELRIISADGATERVMADGILPDVVVTDLDGNIGYILQASREGSLIVVHAHGDNIPYLKNYLTAIEGRILGTRQVDSTGFTFRLVQNFGGFTDGDRSVALAAHFGAKKLVLAGMDLGDIVGRYSKPYLVEEVKADVRKMKKLAWAKFLLEKITQTYPQIRYYNITARGEMINGYERIDIKKLSEMLLEGDRS